DVGWRRTSDDKRSTLVELRDLGAVAVIDHERRPRVEDCLAALERRPRLAAVGPAVCSIAQDLAFEHPAVGEKTQGLRRGAWVAAGLAMPDLKKTTLGWAHAPHQQPVSPVPPAPAYANGTQNPPFGHAATVPQHAQQPTYPAQSQYPQHVQQPQPQYAQQQPQYP